MLRANGIWTISIISLPLFLYVFSPVNTDVTEGNSFGGMGVLMVYVFDAIFSYTLYFKFSPAHKYFLFSLAATPSPRTIVFRTCYTLLKDND